MQALGAGEAMRRREFIRLSSSTVVAWPLTVRAAVSGASDWVSPQLGLDVPQSLGVAADEVIE